MDAQGTTFAADCRKMARSCTCFRLRRAARAVTQHFDAALAPSGLRVTQLAVLVGVSVRGPIPLSELADDLGMDRTTLTRNLKPLLAADLLAVASGPDRRYREVDLTSAGKRALSGAVPLWRQAQRAVVSSLGEETWRTMMGSLSAAIDAVAAL
ncbi:MAG TPA: MarR family winged helix-turn-helix transcriptional regulator [Thermoanaerobaculia bacterium]